MTESTKGGHCAALQENLAPALSALKKSVKGNPALPVLEYVLLTTGDAQLRLTCTDIEVAQTFIIGAKIDMDFSVAIHLDTAQKLVALLDKGRIDIRYDGEHVELKVPYNVTRLNTIPAVEFPLVSAKPATDMLGTLRDFQAARKAVDQIAKVAGDSHIQIMAGQDSIRFTAHADSRVQMTIATLETMGDGPTETLTTYASAKALNRVFKALDTKDTLVPLGLYREGDFTAFVITHGVQDVRIQCTDSKITYPTFEPLAKWYLPTGKVLTKDKAESLTFHFDQAQFTSDTISVPVIPGDSLGNDADNHVINEAAYSRVFHRQLVFDGSALKALHKTLTSFGKKPIEIMLGTGNTLILSDGICQHIILGQPAKQLTGHLQHGQPPVYGMGVILLDDGAIIDQYGYEVAGNTVIAYQVYDGKRVYSHKIASDPKSFARHLYSHTIPPTGYQTYRKPDKATVQRLVEHFAPKPPSPCDTLRAQLDTMLPEHFTRCAETIQSRQVLCNATILGYWPEHLLAQSNDKYYLIATRLREAYEVSIQEETR